MNDTHPSQKTNATMLAYISLSTALLFGALLTLLHVIKPELAPSWRMISEYQLGRYGWVMHVTFFSLTLSVLCLYVLVRPEVSGKMGKVGLFFLLLVAAGVFLGGAFKTASILTPRDQISGINMLHNLGGTLAIFDMPFATLFLTLALSHESIPKRGRTLLLSLSGAIWISLIAFIVVVVVKGRGGPHAPMGIPNRAFMGFFVLWIVGLNLHLLKNKKP
ncbi:MAG: DUF998 domain-containing protein [Myxococcales bacterium]|nr:DUF998 domain-containing protein [Myxococcales bacterium]